MNRNITDKREQISDAPALYFIQPTKENIDLICQVRKERRINFYSNFLF